MRITIYEAARPEDGSPEDLASRERVRLLYWGLERLSEPMIPGSPPLEDELRARGIFALSVAAGRPIFEALDIAQALASLRQLTVKLECPR